MARLPIPSLERLTGLPSDVVDALRTIPDILEATRQSAAHTAQLNEVAEQTSVLKDMDGRMAAIEEAMPVLVEVQRHLARLPETMEALLKALDRLNENVDRLQES